MKFSHFSSLILAVTMASSNAEEKCGSAYQFGNYYVALAFDDYISWEDAKNYVDGMLPPFCGVQGSLVDIRSADENEVVWGTIGGCVEGEEYEWAWIGACCWVEVAWSMHLDSNSDYFLYNGSVTILRYDRFEVLHI